MYRKGFPGGSVVKNLSANAGDMIWIPRLRRSPGERNGNPLQHSCLGNPMDRGAWWAIVHGVAGLRHNLETKPPPKCVQKGMTPDLHFRTFPLIAV